MAIYHVLREGEEAPSRYVSRSRSDADRHAEGLAEASGETYYIVEVKPGRQIKTVTHGIRYDGGGTK